MDAHAPRTPPHAQTTCDRFEACAGYAYWAGRGMCNTFGAGLLEGGKPPGWVYLSGTGGTDLITRTDGDTNHRCRRKQRPGGAWCTCAQQHPRPVGRTTAFPQPTPTPTPTGVPVCEHPSARTPRPSHRRHLPSALAGTVVAWPPSWKKKLTYAPRAPPVSRLRFRSSSRHNSGLHHVDSPSPHERPRCQLCVSKHY